MEVGRGKTRVNRGPDKIGVVDRTERLSFVTKYTSERRTVTAETPKKYKRGFLSRS
jgi:hypothetical protein